MTRDEVLQLRNQLQALIDQLRRLGDYDASARSIRETAEAVLKLTQHLLDRMRKP